MAQAEVPLKRVEEWRRKGFELFNTSKDGLYSLMTKGLDPIVLFLDESSDRNHIQRALRSFDFERNLTMEFEGSNVDPLREMMYGFIESVNLAFHFLIEKNDVLQAQIDGRPQKSLALKHTQTDMSSWDFTEEAIAIKMEELINENEEHSSHNENANGNADHPLSVANSLAALSTAPTFTHKLLEPKKEKVELKEDPIDTAQTMPQDNQISGLDFVGDDMGLMEEEILNDDVIRNDHDVTAEENPLNEQEIIVGDVDGMEQVLGEEGDESMTDDLVEKDGEKNETVGPIADTPKDSSDSVEVEKRRRSSRNVAKSLKYTESVDDSDEEGEPSVKKPRSEKKKRDGKGKSSDNGQHKSESSNKYRRVTKMSDTEMECPECDYTSRSVDGWLHHLRKNHSTTPALAGLAILCECGHESLSARHSENCVIANFTVIRKRGGPIRRLDDDKTTPQCILCEAYPKTPRGYSAHLRVHHSSTLNDNGIYLTCDCGLAVHSGYDNTHSEGCDHREFSLHKLNEKVYSTPACILCETHPNTPTGYADHLRKHHQSTLITNGIYIICVCGLKVRSHNDNIHSEGCDHRQFSLHKLNEN